MKKSVTKIAMTISARATAIKIMNAKPYGTVVACVFPVTWNVEYPFAVRNRTYTLEVEKTCSINCIK